MTQQRTLQTLGPLMLDIAGIALNAEDRELLRHPAVGGLLLFSRNYQDPEQLRALTTEVKALRTPALPIAVDHEGGRVQRFREGFSALPSAACFEQLAWRDAQVAADAAFAAAWLMATELGAAGVDFSFAPVLDVERGLSRVIGDRAFGHDARMVANLAGAWMAGAAAGGMASCGKHFPGHGAVVADSHLEIPIDPRPLAEIEDEDLPPFKALIDQGLQAIMPAHLVYPAVDPQPAGYSVFWLKTLLRERLGFQGLVFSDDLGMAGAALAQVSPVNAESPETGSAVLPIEERALRALAAGCDQVLVCNDRTAAIRVADRLAGMLNKDTRRAGGIARTADGGIERAAVQDATARSSDAASTLARSLTERLAAMYWRQPASLEMDRASAQQRLRPALELRDTETLTADPTVGHLA